MVSERLKSLFLIPSIVATPLRIVISKILDHSTRCRERRQYIENIFKTLSSHTKR